MPGLSGARRTSDPESVTALRTFLATTSGGSRIVDGPLLGAVGRGHPRFGILEVHDLRADLRVAALGHHELFAEPRVEPLRDVAHQLDVLALIVADRDVGSSVREHVGCHEHGVEEQARGHQLALLFGLLLELVHPAEIAVGRHRAQQPGQLGVLMDVGLPEEDAAVGVEPCCEQDRGRVVEGARADRPGRSPL